MKIDPITIIPSKHRKGRNMIGDWNLLLSAVTLAACLLSFRKPSASGETPHFNSTCSGHQTKSSSIITLQCPDDQWIHVISKLESSNCTSQFNAHNQLFDSSGHRLTVSDSCQPSNSIGNNSTCVENVEVGIPLCSQWNCSEHFVNISYECIQERKIHKMCTDNDFNDASDTIYLASPSLFNETSQKHNCTCVVNGSRIEVQVLYSSAETALEIWSDVCNKTDDYRYPVVTINSDFCLHSDKKNMSFVHARLSEADETKQVWIRFKGGNLSLQCNDNITDVATPTPTNVASTTDPSPAEAPTAHPTSDSTRVQTTDSKPVSTTGNSSGGSTETSEPASNTSEPASNTSEPASNTSVGTSESPSPLKTSSGLQEIHMYIIIGICAAAIVLLCVTIFICVRRRARAQSARRSKGVGIPLKVLPPEQERRNPHPDPTAPVAQYHLGGYANDLEASFLSGVDNGNTRPGVNHRDINGGLLLILHKGNHTACPAYEEEEDTARLSDPYYSEIKDTDQSLSTAATERLNARLAGGKLCEDGRTERPVSGGDYEVVDLDCDDGQEEDTEPKLKPRLKPQSPRQQVLVDTKCSYQRSTKTAPSKICPSHSRGAEAADDSDDEVVMFNNVAYVSSELTAADDSDDEVVMVDNPTYESADTVVGAVATEGRHNYGFAEDAVGDEDEVVMFNNVAYV